MRDARFFLGLAGVVAALNGCSALVDPDLDELGPPPAACEPGAVRSCVCSGLTGSQRCTDSGAFTPCDCSRPGGSGGAGRGGAGAGGSAGTAGRAGAGGSAGAAGRGQGGRGGSGSR